MVPCGVEAINQARLLMRKAAREREDHCRERDDGMDGGKATEAFGERKSAAKK